MACIRRYAIALSLLMSAAFSGCDRQSTAASNAQLEHNKTLVGRWIAAGFNERVLTVVDEVFADSVAVNGIVIPRDGLKQNMSRHFAGFPDLHVTIDAIVAEGNNVGIWYTGEGTHQGTFDSISPTNKHLKWDGVDLLTFDRGKVSEAIFLSELPAQLSVAAK